MEQQLSVEATRLYEHLKQTSGTWMQKCVEYFWPEPKYIGTMDEHFTNKEKQTAQRAYWQWEANLYGNERIRPVLGEAEKFTPTDNYMNKISQWYQELRKAGKAGESNNGYNEYWIYTI